MSFKFNFIKDPEIQQSLDIPIKFFVGDQVFVVENNMIVKTCIERIELSVIFIREQKDIEISFYLKHASRPYKSEQLFNLVSSTPIMNVIDELIPPVEKPDNEEELPF